MTARAEASVFWPGITPVISTLRARCDHCNRIAPSNPSSPPTPLTSPVYPFQCICADFFHYKGCNYLVVVDRYSNWPIVERSTHGVDGLTACLRRIFVTFGIPDELASDGGPEFTAAVTRRFLQDWGIHHRLPSVAYPHSNCRDEVGVQTIKRLLLDNTSPTGALDTNAFQCFSTGTRLTGTPSFRPPCAYSTIPFGTSFRWRPANTSLTALGVRPLRLGKMHCAIAT
eukprot:XP_011678029.1 PREDICTED: uncharacterized protein K02A2.6-like [Strongylocentrotus purpuratus]